MLIILSGLFETWASSPKPREVMERLDCLACGWPPLRDLCRPHSLRGHHWDVQAVGQARRIHGRRLRPLALQLHRRPHLPLPGGQLNNVFRTLQLKGRKVCQCFVFFLQCKQRENSSHILMGIIYSKLSVIVGNVCSDEYCVSQDLLTKL